MIFLALLIFLYPPAVLGNEAFMPFEKFTVRQELSPDYTLMLPPRYSLEEFEDFSHLVESETLQEKKNEARAGSRIRLNFSRMMSAGESVDPFERGQWLAAQRVDVLIPRFQGRETHLLCPARVDARGRRRDCLLDRLLELLAVLRGVVEPVHLLPTEGTIVSEASVLRHREPQLEQLLP